MAGWGITLAGFILALVTTLVVLTWNIRGKLDSIDHRLDRLEDLAGIERSR